MVVSALLPVFFFLSAHSVHAATRTWDGGGVDNNWSTCANWSSNLCPGSADDVVFDATSTKAATINAGFTGTVLSVNINSGYTNTITQSRNLVVNGAFNMNTGTTATWAGANTLDVNTSGFNIQAGTFTAPATLNVERAFTINAAATFNHNSGTINLDGTSIAGTFTISCGNKTFNLVNVNATGTSAIKNVSSDCTLPLGNNPTIAVGFQLAGTISGTGTLNFTSTSNSLVFNTGAAMTGFTGLSTSATTTSIQINGANMNFGSFTTFDINSTSSSALQLISGSLTMRNGNSTIAGGINFTGGTFNANGGTITFDGTGSTAITLSCNNATFNSVVLSSSRRVLSSCNLPVGNNPSLPAVNLEGTLSGSGAITFSASGTTTFNSSNPLSGFTALNANGIFILSGGTANFTGFTNLNFNSTYTQSIGTFIGGSATVDMNNSFTLSSGSYTASSGTTFASNNFIINGGTFNANGGTITFDGTTNTSINCNNATFNLVTFAHTAGVKSVAADCNLPLGNNPTIAQGVSVFGTLSGTGTITTPTAIATFSYNSSTALSGFTGLNAQAGSFTVNSPYHFNMSGYSNVDINNFFTVTSGATLTAPAGTINFTGSVLRFESFSTFNNNGGTIAVTGSSVGSLECFDPAIVLSGLTVNHTASVKDLVGCQANVGNNPTLVGVLEVTGFDFIGTGTLTFNNDLTAANGNSFTGFSSAVVNGNFTSNGTNDLSTLPTVDFNGDVTLESQTTFPAGTSTVAGDFHCASPSYLQANGGTVALDGTNQVLSGFCVFNDLNKNVTSPDTLYITAGSGNWLRIDGTMNFSGTSGNLLSLRSTVPGTQARIGPRDRTIQYLDVQDIYNTHPVEIETAGLNITNSGNNFGWDFTNNANIADQTGYTTSPFDDQFREVDLLYGDTLSSNSITLPGFTVLSSNGLAYEPYSCTLYGVLRLQGQSGRQLVTINPATAVATSVGNTGRNIAGIAFDNNGTLYAVTGDGDSTPETLYTVNTSTGALTLATALGNGGSGETIAYNSDDGYLYHLSGSESNLAYERLQLPGYALTDIPETLISGYGWEATGMMYSVPESRFIVAVFDELTRLSLTGEQSTFISLDHDIKGLVPQTCEPLVSPDAPTTLGPAAVVNGGTITSTTPTFTFNLSDDNASQQVRYQIQIDDTADFSSPLVDYTSALAAQGAFSFQIGQAVGGGSYTVGSSGQTLALGSYYWRVKTIDEVAMESSYTIANGGSVAFVVTEVADLTMSVSQTQATVGQRLSLTVRAVNGSNSTATSYTGTVDFTSTSTTAVLPANYTFSGSDAGERTFTNQLIFTQAGTYTVTVTDLSNGSLTATTANIVVTANSTVVPTFEDCGISPYTAYCQQEVEISNVKINQDSAAGGVEICFETNVETIGYIEYGLVGNEVLNETTDQTDDYRRRYCITVSGLEENSEYQFRITATSQAGKSKNYGAMFVTGELVPNPPASCIALNNGISFNSSAEAILNYSTVAEARCTVSYGVNSVLQSTERTPLGANHSSKIDLKIGDGMQDIRYTITCEFENQTYNQCSLPGTIPASQYRDFIQDPKSPDFSTLLASWLKNLSSEVLPLVLIGGSILAAVTTLLSDPRMLLHGYAWFKLRNKPMPWGIIYDANDATPLGFVTARLYLIDSGNKQFIKEDLSGVDGKYGFVVDPGQYMLEVKHDDYLLFTKEIKIEKLDTLINQDIPLRRNQTLATNIRYFLKQNRRILNTVIFVVGILISLIAMAISPSGLNAFVVGLYVVNCILLFVFVPKFGPGFAFDVQTKTRVKGAFVRLFDQKQGRQVDVKLTDESGRYGFKIGPGDYLVNVYAPQYQLATQSVPADQLVEQNGLQFVKAKLKPDQNLDTKLPLQRSGEVAGGLMSPF